MDELHQLANEGWDERIIVCACGTLVQVCIVITERYVVLIDTLLNEATATALLDLARPFLIKGRQLVAVNTHADWDHAWGNQLFVGPTAHHAAPVVGSERCAARLRSDEEQHSLATMRAAEPARFAGVRLVPPSIAFNDRLTIDGGDLTLELFPTPGHQPDHIAVFIPEIRTLLAGDAAEDPFPIVNTADDLAELRASLARMIALQPRNALYCHAPVTSGPALLQRNQGYFDTLEQRCRAALAAGLALPLADNADVETLVGFPLADALLPGRDVDDLDPLYLPSHRKAIRVMLEWSSRTPRRS